MEAQEHVSRLDMETVSNYGLDYLGVMFLRAEER